MHLVPSQGFISLQFHSYPAFYFIVFLLYFIPMSFPFHSYPAIYFIVCPGQ